MVAAARALARSSSARVINTPAVWSCTGGCAVPNSTYLPPEALASVPVAAPLDNVAFSTCRSTVVGVAAEGLSANGIIASAIAAMNIPLPHANTTLLRFKKTCRCLLRLFGDAIGLCFIRGFATSKYTHGHIKLKRFNAL